VGERRAWLPSVAPPALRLGRRLPPAPESSAPLTFRGPRSQRDTPTRARWRFVVHSEERLEYERGEREKAMQRVQEELEALQQRVAQGKLKAPEKIGAAASRVLSRHHGFRYYAWELKQGQFHYFEHPENLQQEKALEGKYLIQSEEPNLSPLEAVEI
jgi:hypothetical protein